MSISVHSVRALFFVTLVLAPGAVAYGQPPARAGSLSAWSLGVSPGLWNRVPTSEGRRNGTAWDACLERRIGDGRIRAIRVQLGTGAGEKPLEPGFNYSRLLLGIVREVTTASQPPFTVYVAAGAGVYELRSPAGRTERPSAYGSVGFDARLGKSPASISAEVQVHTIGSAVYGTTSLGVRIHLG
jgi:hypothetical protein